MICPQAVPGTGLEALEVADSAEVCAVVDPTEVSPAPASYRVSTDKCWVEPKAAAGVKPYKSKTM